MDERPDQETVSARYVGTNIPEPYFHDIVRRTKEYIKAGDIYQTNLSQRLHLELESDPYRFYDVLLGINPSPFSAFLRFGRLTIGSCSPERLFKVTRKRLETRPIAGTRRRGKTPEEDSEMYSELIKSEKERAEHLMLVDLERNDMGRVCRYGTVHVDEFMVREAYSHVWHIVSNITGELRPELDALDALTALFPGGTITGAPKIRAMEIIEEMEPVRRGLYTGSIGYIADSGDADFSIVIRTFILHEKNAYIQVGSGIVADSDPHLEYRESLNKAAALLKAAGVTV
jgi:para-aminobenzoate synthetase component 1